jgi:hypothetical protein
MPCPSATYRYTVLQRSEQPIFQDCPNESNTFGQPLGLSLRAYGRRRFPSSVVTGVTRLFVGAAIPWQAHPSLARYRLHAHGRASIAQESGRRPVGSPREGSSAGGRGSAILRYHFPELGSVLASELSASTAGCGVRTARPGRAAKRSRRRAAGSRTWRRLSPATPPIREGPSNAPPRRVDPDVKVPSN